MTPTAFSRDLRRDVETLADVEVIVRAFYQDIHAEPLLGRFFIDLDMDIHIEKLARFWSGIVFHTGTYRGRPFDPHARLDGLTRDHFADWLRRFHAVVDAHFQGERATLMKDRAAQIAHVFQMKLGLWEVMDAS